MHWICQSGIQLITLNFILLQITTTKLLIFLIKPKFQLKLITQTTKFMITFSLQEPISVVQLNINQTPN